MQFSDTHCHLYSEQFDSDQELIVKEALDSGIQRFFLPNIDSSYTNRLHQLYHKYPKHMFPMMGLHPCSVKENFEEELAHMKSHLDNPGNVPYIGVGEIGIDLYWDKSFFNQQQQAFRIQCEWAKELDLPIIIHVRDAFEEVFELMDEVISPELKGIFHCFTGGTKEAEKILSYPNFLVGIGGVVTFKNSGLGDVVKHIPLDRIVLETDSPYLAPHPKRGKRNEPNYLLYVAEKIAQLHGISLEELSVITEKNANAIFKIPD